MKELTVEEQEKLKETIGKMCRNDGYDGIILILLILFYGGKKNDD